jgi:succinyl-CoA synthetase beta subunit
MKLFEYEGAELFRREGISVPHSSLASSPNEAKEKAQEIGLPVIIKAQVLTGGRYLAGGVRTAYLLDNVEQIAAHILGSKIHGLPVEKVLITHKLEIEKEYYLAITVDSYLGIPVAIVSASGGVSINGTASEKPEAVVTKPISIIRGLSLEQARKICREVGLTGKEAASVAEVLCSLYNVFRDYDALLAEINPLVKTKSGKFMAIDSKVELDDSGLYRHPDITFDKNARIYNALERKSKDVGVTYVELDGDIAIIASGAGLGMASMDIINRRMDSANFLETGGGITEDLLYNVMDLVLQKEGIRAVFINVYGGINPIHEGAKGVVRYMQDHNITIPVVAKALGNHQEETWEIFKSHGVHVTDGVSTESGIELLANVLRETK